MWEPESVIKSELSNDERLLWTGQPKQGMVFRGFDGFLIPFSLLWCGFIVLGMAMVFTAGFASEDSESPGSADGENVESTESAEGDVDTPPPSVVAVTVIFLPFSLVGLYMLVGRFVIDAKVRSRTFYGLTDRRIIIISGLMSRKVRTMNLRTLSDISLSEKSDRTGTINFGPSNPMASWANSMPWPGMSGYRTPAFDMIQDARGIYEQLMEAQSQAQETGSAAPG